MASQTEIRKAALQQFVDLSAALTGFEVVELQGTGVAPTYYGEVRDIVGERIFGALLLRWAEADDPTEVVEDILRDPALGPIARNMITMWYTGTWNQLPRAWRQQFGASAHDLTHIVSAQGYREGLIWRAIEAHPTAAKAPGFGSWTPPPGGRPDDIDDGWQDGAMPPAGEE